MAKSDYALAVLQREVESLWNDKKALLKENTSLLNENTLLQKQRAILTETVTSLTKDNLELKRDNLETINEILAKQKDDLFSKMAENSDAEKEAYNNLLKELEEEVTRSVLYQIESFYDASCSEEIENLMKQIFNKYILR